MTRSYFFFWNGPFSQWSPCEMTVGEAVYGCAEQYMMHQKALLFGDGEAAAKILAATDPAKQKALGRTIKGFDETVWRDHREIIVHTGSHAKFDQNKGLRRKLFQTGDALLVEASPLDAIWGVGLSADEAKATPPEEWPGLNLLGKILTKVRNELRLKHPAEAKAVSAFEELWTLEGAAAQ